MTEMDFKLDVSNMSETAERCKKLSELMADMRQTLENYEVDMVNSWSGAGAKAFKDKFHRIVQQFKDLREDLDTIAENILTAQEAYIQTDVDVAKTLDGIQKVGTAQSQKSLKSENFDAGSTVRV